LPHGGEQIRVEVFPPGGDEMNALAAIVVAFGVLGAAFLNTDGGTLIIGVTDDRKIVGIEVDYPRVKGARDGWRLTFDHLVTHELGAEVMNCIDLRLEPWHDRTIAVIRCSPREEPTWIGEELYVRYTASTEKLSTRHAVAWWRQRWG
jgi:predicted HTH transcriptional regulator